MNSSLLSHKPMSPAVRPVPVPVQQHRTLNPSTSLSMVAGVMASIIIGACVPAYAETNSISAPSQIDRIVTIEEVNIPHINESMGYETRQTSSGISSILDQIEDEISKMLVNNETPQEMEQHIDVIEQQIEMAQAML